MVILKIKWYFGVSHEKELADDIIETHYWFFFYFLVCNLFRSITFKFHTQKLYLYYSLPSLSLSSLPKSPSLPLNMINSSMIIVVTHTYTHFSLTHAYVPTHTTYTYNCLNPFSGVQLDMGLGLIILFQLTYHRTCAWIKLIPPLSQHRLFAWSFSFRVEIFPHPHWQIHWCHYEGLI